MPGLDTFTKLLLHMDGANGGTTFTDSANLHTVTALGGAVTSTTGFKFGTGAGHFSAAGDYLTVPDSNDWNFSTGDVSIDFVVHMTAATGSLRPFIWQEQGAGTWLFGLNTGGSEVIQFFYVDTGGVTRANYFAAHNISLNTLTHIALVRSGTSIFIMKEGVPYSLTVGTAIGSTAMPDFSGTLNIGGRDVGMGGRMDEVRVSKGIARWTSTFTPPTVAYDGIHETVGAASGTGASAGVGASIAASAGLATGTGTALGDHTIDAAVGTATGTGAAYGIGIDEADVVGSCAAYHVRGHLGASYDVTGEARV